MIYTLTKNKKDFSGGFVSSIKRLVPFLRNEKRNLLVALVAVIVSSAANLVAPVIVGHAIDTSIRLKDFHGVLMYALILVAVFIVGLIAGYINTITMGGVGRRLLFNLRNDLFSKLSSLPLAFFKQNKSGDLISRINSDTDKLNQFFSQALMQFVGGAFQILGAGIFLVVLNQKLGTASLLPALLVLILTRLLSGWIKSRNKKSLETTGSMSAEIQESLYNFRVIVAFNRLDYFRKKFAEANDRNFDSSVKAGMANSVLTPIYGLAGNAAQLIVLAYGIYLINAGNFTIGLLVGYLLYVTSFYNPLRQMAALLSSFELSMAALDRISEVLDLESDMKDVTSNEAENSKTVIEFKDVEFHYSDSETIILKDVNLSLERGKTYALVGPTGGGKTTTAGLIARLYDPTKGEVLLDGRDIRSYSGKERTRRIGYILQEPFLFSGTVGDNLLYGNPHAKDNKQRLKELLEEAGLRDLLKRFPQGLETEIKSEGNSFSLGERQIIAFMRAVLRKPEILILDEATANIDTVTEEILQSILDRLPKETTKIIIAHRLNTIKNADEIFFVNGVHVELAGSFESALDLLLHGKRQS